MSQALEEARAVELDRHSIAQEKLDIRDRVRTSAFPWRGQFSPGLVETLLGINARDSHHVLDPFAGGGTTLFEALRHGIQATAYEINPAALELAKVALFGNLSVDERKLHLKEAANLIDSCFGQILSDLPELDGHSILGRAQKAYFSAANPHVRNLVAVTIMLGMGSGRTLTTAAIYKSFRWVKAVVEGLPMESRIVSVEAHDARALPMESSSVDLVLTSPPYINVFNYHQNYRPAMELLGWRVLPIARSEIGSNRANRGNRFLTVIQYCLDMAMALSEMARITKDEGQIIIVIGRESNVRGVSFANGEILAALALMSGQAELKRWQERRFTNRFGEAIYEDILTLQVIQRAAQVDASSSGRAMSDLILSAARATSRLDVRADIDDALSRVETMVASPMFGETHKVSPRSTIVPGMD